MNMRKVKMEVDQANQKFDYRDYGLQIPIDDMLINETFYSSFDLQYFIIFTKKNFEFNTQFLTCCVWKKIQDRFLL